MYNKQLLFFISLVVGFVVFQVFGSQGANKNPRIGKNVILYFGNNVCFHFHHWITATLLMGIISSAIYFSGGTLTAPIVVVYGLCLGSIINSGTYRDMFRMIKRCDRAPV